jgi:hypothetical protein
MPLTNIFDPSSAVNTGTDQITISSHGFLPNQGVLYSNGGGTSIGGLVNNYKYYIIYINANTVQLANTEDEARENIAVDLLSTGSGAIHSFTETNIFPNSAAYYDFYRRLRLIGDGLPIEGVTLEADSVRDSLTLIAGNNITLECDTNDIELDQFTINAPNYDLKFLTGTSDLRLYNDAGLDASVRFKAGTGVAITHNSLTEIEFTSFGVTESDTLESVTTRGNITNNRLVMNNLTVAEVISTPGIDGVSGISGSKIGTTNINTAGDGTLDNVFRFTNTITSSSDPAETITINFTVPNAGTLSYVANYIAESAMLITGDVTLQRQDPSTLIWTNLESQSGILARTGYSIEGIYAELNFTPVNYRIIWNWTGNTSFVRLSFNIYFEVEPVAGYELIKSTTETKNLILGVDDGAITVRGPTTFTGLIDTQGLRIYQNNIVGINSNDDIVVDLNGTGALELRATTFNTDQTTFNLINTTATTVNAFGAATSINIGANTGTVTIRNPTVVGTQTTQNLYNTTATTVNAFGAATAVNIGAAGGSGALTVSNDNVVLDGDLQVKGGDLTTNQTTFNLLDATATTVNAFGAATAIDIGANTGTITINNPTLVGTQTTQNVYDTVATTVNAFGAATAIDLGATTGTLTINNPTVVGTQSTQNLYNTTATTVNFAGAASTMNMGASGAGGTLTIRNDNVVMNGDLQVQGGDITTNQTSFNLLDGTATTIQAFGAATTLTFSTAGGTTTVRGDVVINQDLQIKGGDLTTNALTFNLLNTDATTINAFGAASTINLRNLVITSSNTIDSSDSSAITFIPLVTFNSDVNVENDANVARALTVGTNLTVGGDLIVNGNTTTLNTTTLDVEDLNITVAKGSVSAAASNGAGLTVEGPTTPARLTYTSSTDRWNFNKSVTATSVEDTPVGFSVPASGRFTTMTATATVILGSSSGSSLSNIQISGKFTAGAATFRADTTAANTLSLAAYDTDSALPNPALGAGWDNLVTLTSGTEPTLTLTSTGVGTINNMSIGATTASTGRFTTLEVRDTTTTGFDLFFASNSSTALTADRILTFDVVNAARTIKLAGNIDLANNLTTGGAVSFSGAFSFTGTLSNNTSVTFPTTGTLATLTGSESLTNKKLGSLTSNGIVTTSGGDGTLSVTATTGSGNVVLGTNPTVAGVTHGNTSSTSDADATVDAATNTFYAYVQSASGTTRTINISNLTAGRMIKLYLRNTNASPKTINITASTTTSGFAAVNMSKGDAGGTSVTSVTLVATSGTSVVTVFNANGTFGGTVG